MLPKKIVVLNNGGHRPDSRVWRVASARVLGLRTQLQFLYFIVFVWVPMTFDSPPKYSTEKYCFCLAPILLKILFLSV